MNRISQLFAVLFALSPVFLPRASWGTTTAFTYQGQLGKDGERANGKYEMVFQLLLSGTTTTAGDPITEIVEVREGIFNATLDFGEGVFDGTDYDLQISVKEEGAPGRPIPLDPPQRITPTPQAIHATTASQVPDSALSSNVPIIVNNVLGLQGPDAKLTFGPEGESSIGIDPQFSGFVERDPVGFRFLGRNDEGGRLLFGPTDDCTIGIDPAGPSGVLIRDPEGLRILNPFGEEASLRFGPTNECRLLADPKFSGLSLKDPGGFRLLGQDLKGMRLLFGPTDDCSIGIDPDGPGGVLIRDPDGLRVINSDPRSPEGNMLRFGTGDGCRISAGSESFQGVMFSDPGGFLFTNPQGAGGADVNVDGALLANEFVQTSSRRFKKNIRQIENPLDKVRQLRGVSFEWVSDKGGKSSIGFIAEEVGKVVPEVVAWEKDEKSARGVNYGHLVALAVESIKAQQSEIESLTRKNHELEQRLEKLEDLFLKTSKATGE